MKRQLCIMASAPCGTGRLRNQASRKISKIEWKKMNESMFQKFQKHGQQGCSCRH